MYRRNKKSQKKHIVTFVVVGVLVSAAIIGCLVLYSRPKVASVNAKAPATNQGRPKFVFDTVKTPGWLTLGNNWPDASAADPAYRNEVPVSDISVHQCKAMSHCASLDTDVIGGNCFVMASYNKGAENLDKKLADTIEQNRKFGTTIEEVGVKMLKISTYEGEKDYQLHLYDYQSKGGEALLRGNALGYVPLSDGYIDMRAVCAEASQLEQSIPTIQALRLAM